MTDPASAVPEAGTTEAAEYYAQEFWRTANLKFSEPWYRIQKAARLINKLTAGRSVALLDVGCGPGTLGRLLAPNISYHGIDISIPYPAPSLREADLTKSPIEFAGQTFDFVVAQGLFEYLGNVQSAKFAEVAALLTPGGRFLVSYTNFGHRKPTIYEAFSNVQPLSAFRADLARHFTVDRVYPASHNWKHSQPDRPLVKAANMRLNANIPVLQRRLAVDYFFLCTATR